MRIATNRDDVHSEIDGVWVPYGDDGCQLLIARMGNPANRKAYERAQSKYRSKLRRGKQLSPDQNIEIMARCLSESILLDWKGVQDMEDNDLEYSQETAYQALRWDLDLREFVTDQADLAENFRQQEVNTKGKKLPAGSGGKSGGATKEKS